MPTITSLSKLGANANTADKDGLTPLHLAARSSVFEVSEFLMDYGADCSAVSKYGMTPLTTAIVKSCQELVEPILHRNGPKILHDAHGWGALHAAARHSSTPECPLIELMIENGIDVSKTDSNGWTHLLHAQKLDVVECLLNHGADVETGSCQYASPLSAVMLRHAATDLAARNQMDMVRLVLKHGAYVNARGPDNSLDTPLYAAAIRNRVEAAELLTQSGARLDLAARDGWTPLQIATRKGHDAMVALLISAGAHPGVNAASPEPLDYLEPRCPGFPYSP